MQIFTRARMRFIKDMHFFPNKQKQNAFASCSIFFDY